MPNFQPVVILPALSTDAARMIRIHPVAGRAGWTEVGLRSFLGMSEAVASMAWTEEAVVGYYVARMIPPEVELLLIAVATTSGRRGIGGQLLRHLYQQVLRHGCETCFLEVRAGNQTAINFYLKHGFTRLGLRKRYYRNPVEDAVLMSCDLNGQKNRDEDTRRPHQT